MKNSKVILPVLAILLCMSLSCTFLKDRFANGGEPAHEFSKIAKLPPLDPKGPFISPGAVAVRKLAEVDSGVAAFASGIEATERGAMKKIITANSVQPETDKKKDKALLNSPSGNTRLATIGFPKPMQQMTSLLMFQAGDTPLPGANDGVIVGMLAGMFKGLLSEVPVGSFSKKDSKTETSEGTATTMDFELGGSEDGSTVFGLGLKTESTKNGVKVTTEMTAKIEGNDCPNTEGQVQITVKMRLSARSGGAGYTQDVTAFIRILVDDSANNSGTTIDIDQATSRGKNGQEVYVQTGETVKYGPNFSGAAVSNQRVIQKTDNATGSDVSETSGSGHSSAYGAAIGAIVLAESTWKGGKCIKIEAKSPGGVAPSSKTEIPVKVRHKRDGTDVVAKLEAALSGEYSVDPTLIPKTPGTLTYTAPGETGKSATIQLKATSRRGIAKLDLDATTGSNSFQVVGGLDDWQTDTKVCDIMKPFRLTGGGITMKVSGGLSGTYDYTGPFNAKGTGTYTITFPEGRAKYGYMVGTGEGSVTGGFTGSGTEIYILTPIDPCGDKDHN